MKIPCPQCGGDVPLRGPENLPACPFCGTTFILDLTGVHPHFLYRPRLDPADILPLVRRWADRLGHHAPAQPASPRLVYYPFWRYVREGPRRLVPAWATLEEAWAILAPPDAEQLFFDPSLVRKADLVEPTVPEAAARRRAFGGTETPAGDLVRLPVYEMPIRLGQRELLVVVEACSGTVVRPGGWGPDRGGTGTAWRTGWMLGGGVLMLVAAVAIRPWAGAGLAVGILAFLLVFALAPKNQK